MFKNTLTILITVGVLIAIVIALQFVKTQEKGVSEAIKAIPEDAAILIETNHFFSLLKNFNSENKFKQEFSDIEQLKKFNEQSEYIDSLLTNNQELQSIIEGNKIMISGHVSANNILEYLFTVPVKDKKFIDVIHKIINDLVSNDATVRQRLYEGNTIYDVVFFREEMAFNGFSYAFADGIFIFCLSKIQVEASLRRLKKGFSLANDNAFIKLYETAGKNVDANIYVNYKYLPNILKNVLKSDNSGLYEFIGSFASWTELDVMMKKDAFLMSGFSFSDDSLNHYLNLFKTQHSLENHFLEALPENTASFVAFNLSDPGAWKEAYFKFLRKKGKYDRIDEEFEKIEKKYGKGKSKVFYDNLEGGLAMVWTNGNSENNAHEPLAIMQMKDAEKMLLELEFFKKADTLNEERSYKSVVIDQNSGVLAHSFPENRIFSYMFGRMFDDMNTAWYINYKGYLVFGESAEVLKTYLRNLKTAHRIKNDKYFELFSKSISSESNLFIYTNISDSKNIISSDLNSNYNKIYNNNIEKFNKIQGASIQFTASNNLLSTNLYFCFKPGFSKSSKNSWEVSLEYPLDKKPQIVKSHVSGNNEIILQDTAHNLMLVSETGKLLWKKKLSGKILGEIHQVDLFKNNKLQFLFNTRDYLYLVDRNGKDVNEYPIKLKSPATNGMAVFDYDKDRTYRILIACENKNVYLLTTGGGKVDGWQFEQTESEVVLPAQHFINNSKDYIVFGDKSNTYIVNRRGEIRVSVKSKFEKNPKTSYFFEKGESENDSRFVTTGVNGDIFFIFLDGTVKKMTIDEFSPNHTFMYTDIDGDGKFQFIFADKNKLFVYDRSKSLKFEKKFDGPIENSLNLYQITKNHKYLGVAPMGTSKIFLLNQDGTIIKGFPLQGKGEFSIAKLVSSEKNKELNLVVSSEDNFLLNYRLNFGEPNK